MPSFSAMQARALLPVISASQGHADARMTEHYTHLISLQAVRYAVEARPGKRGWRLIAFGQLAKVGFPPTLAVARSQRGFTGTVPGGHRRELSLSPASRIVMCIWVAAVATGSRSI